MPKLKQGFGVFLAVAINPQKILGCHAENCRQCDASQCAKTGTDGFFAQAAQNHEGGCRHQHRDQKGGGDGGPAPQQQRQQNPHKSRNRQNQAYQTFGAHLSTHQHRYQKEYRHNCQQSRRPVGLVHIAPHGAVGVGGQTHSDGIARLKALAVYGSHGVVGQHPGSRVLAGFYGDN